MTDSTILTNALSADERDATSAATAAVGNDNPTLSFGLAPINDWGTNSPFIDIMKIARNWIGHEEGTWGGFSGGDLSAGGYIDENGWITGIPDGLDSVGTVWNWGSGGEIESRKGTYVLAYEGEGTIQMKNVTILEQANGRIVFENIKGRSMELLITETDPDKTGDYIRDISVVHEDHVDLYEAGAVFNPDWLDVVSDSRELRFMDWMGTNGATIDSWDDRAEVTDAIWRSKGGVPVEIMVQLANEAGVDPWFNMPHTADDDYIREFATYVRDNLDPELTARVEFSNEVWNFAFTQAHWAQDKSIEEWGEDAYLDYQAMRATQVAVIWEDVFSETTDHPELINVMGAQTANAWAANRLLTAPRWELHDPDGYVDPASVFDELAITTYFGVSTISKGALRAELLAAIADPSIDTNAWLAEKLMDPDYSKSIPQIQNEWAQIKAVADQHGLDMVAYEGGQHVHHSFAVSGLTDEQTSALTAFMTDFVRSQEMADLYSTLWDAWAEVSDGAFMQFGDVGPSSKWGSWELLDDLDDSTPRSEFLFDKADSTTPWWDASANDAYLQGVNITGTDQDDLLLGTSQEDYLAGGKGNDIFIAGEGKDGINGGPGTDTLVLTGQASDYSIVAQGEGHIISGPDGEKFVINLEALEFDGGVIQTLADFLSGVVPAPTEPVPVEPTPTEPVPVEPTPTEPVPVEETPTNEQTGDAESNTITGGSDADTLVGLGGDDALDGKGGDDDLYGNSGNDFIRGGGGNDRLNGDEGNDLLVGWGGSDTFEGGAGDDRLVGGRGDDILYGNEGNDVIRGNSGNDIIYGNEGNDLLLGWGDNDTLKGGAGDDRLVGGKGNDTLEGGAGSDRFYFQAKSDADTITDFSSEDTLYLDGFLSKKQSLTEAAGEDENGDLIISNGVDTITFEGLDIEDMSWMNVTIA